MARLESGFIPLPDAQSEKIRINLDLPSFIDKHKIGLNLSATESMMQMGGVKHLRISTETEGETTSQEVNIVGFTNQGEAFAGKAKTTNIPTAQYDSDLNNDGRNMISHCSEWINVNTTFNIDELATRISQDKRWSEGIRSTDAWASYLNKDIKKSIAKEGTHHLVFGLTRSQLLYMAIMDVPFPPYNNISHVIHSFLLGNTIGNVLGHVLAKLNAEDARYSLFFGPEVDRAAILNIMAKVKTLVKKIEPEE